MEDAVPVIVVILCVLFIAIVLMGFKKLMEKLIRSQQNRSENCKYLVVKRRVDNPS